MRRSIYCTALAGVLVLWTSAPASAQITTGSSGGFTGSSSGGFAGSSSGGFVGGTSSLGGTSTAGRTGSSTGRTTGGFTGSTSFGGGTTTGSLGTTLGSTSYGTTSFQGNFFANPLAIGVPTSSGTGSQYLKAFPEQLTFGTPLYGTANVTSSTSRSSTNAYGTALTTPASPYSGASSAGTRRAPQFITVPVFDLPARPTATVMRADLQGVIARSSSLPSRNGITVSMDGNVVELRGQVRNERERRLAEAVVRLTPGVHEVRNLLVPLAKDGTTRP